MLINATPFNDPFLVHPVDGPHRLLLPTFFLPLSLCRWRRPRLISNLLDGLVHSNFPSNVPDWSPQLICTCIHAHVDTRVSFRGIISPTKKFFIFSGYCCHAFFLLDEKNSMVRLLFLLEK